MMTRSARGFHRYYLRPTAIPEIPALIKPPDGLKIEIKRDGQYVVGPGSVHPGKRWNGLLLPCGIMVPTVKRPLEAKARRSPHGAYDHRRRSRKVRLPGCRVASAG